ncbi:MAG: hypothetical protein Q4C11_02100 [Clostridium sp.]|nr:hypothetical protein [Clostridium sp.]
MKKEIKTKLDLIRIEGLCKLIRSKYNGDEIKSKIYKITEIEVRDEKALDKLSRSQLIKIIEDSNINDEEIEKYYEEYRYGLKPGFSIYSFKSKSKLLPYIVVKKIKAELTKIQYLNEEQPQIKDIKFNNKDIFEEDLCEYSFYYSKKYTYIDEKEEPAYIYELKETFIWISTKYNFVAIKNCDERVSKVLAHIISNIYETELTPIILTQELINKIFGDKRKKVAGVNLNAGDSEAEKIIISDPNLDKKEELKKQLEAYTTTSENLEISISEKSNTLGVNNAKGKLHLTKNMTATVFRNWSVNTIRKIIEFISNNETNFEIFKAKNIMNNPCWNNYNNETKKIIEEIIFKIISYYSDKEHYNPMMDTKIDYSKIINKHFYSKIYLNCDTCGDSHCIPKCDCGSYNIKINQKKDVFCTTCGEKLASLQCEEGHIVNIDNLENINVYLIPKNDMYTTIIKFLEKEFNIYFNGYISISNRGVQITEKSSGTLVKSTEIEEFNEVLKIVVDDNEKDDLQKRLKTIKEKCKESTKDNCNFCKKSSEECCILQLFSTYEGYRPGPHQGHEFGDLDFKVTYKGIEYQFVGIVKSSCNLTHASKEGRGMIQQILSATQDKRVEIIGAVCPVRFDTQLEKDLEYIAKCTQSKIIILDDVFMMKQLKLYKNENG